LLRDGLPRCRMTSRTASFFSGVGGLDECGKLYA
jgi:hypothetical protein